MLRGYSTYLTPGAGVWEITQPIVVFRWIVVKIYILKQINRKIESHLMIFNLEVPSRR